MKAAHLDWRVMKVPLYAAGRRCGIPVPDFFALVRCDLYKRHESECPIFGIVSRSYEPIQNREAFEFLDSIVGAGAAVYHTAGVLGNGERVWMLVKLPGHLTVIGEDIADKYLLLVNDHRAHGAVQVKFTPIRVVCNNTLTAALSDGAPIRIRHYRGAKARLKAAKDALAIIQKRFSDSQEVYQAMCRVMMTDHLLDRYLGAVFPIPKDPTPGDKERVCADRSLARDLFTSGAGNTAPRVSGTLWAAYNGVTELIDHYRPPKMSPESHLASVWFGAGASARNRAFRYALDIIQAKELPPAVSVGDVPSEHSQKSCYGRGGRAQDN